MFIGRVHLRARRYYVGVKIVVLCRVRCKQSQVALGWVWGLFGGHIGTLQPVRAGVCPTLGCPSRDLGVVFRRKVSIIQLMGLRRAPGRLIFPVPPVNCPRLMRLGGFIGALIQRLAGDVVSSIPELLDRPPWVESQVPSTRSVPLAPARGTFKRSPAPCVLLAPQGSNGRGWRESDRSPVGTPRGPRRSLWMDGRWQSLSSRHLGVNRSSYPSPGT